MIDRLARACEKLGKTARHTFMNDSIVLNWPQSGLVGKNWGDKLNRYLAEAITGKKVFNRADVFRWVSKPVHYWIGSHLAAAYADPEACIWGMGFYRYDIPIVGHPKEVRAVRGYLSVERLKKEGYEPPNVVGDVALLLPRFYRPKVRSRRFALGIIPHFREKDEPIFAKARHWPEVTVIDILGDIEEVVDQINSCDRIASSSLHGIICADAYQIPSIWLKASNLPVGDGFKFHDYLSSVGRSVRTPVVIDENSTRLDIEKHFHDYRIQIDLEALWQACPVKSPTI